MIGNLMKFRIVGAPMTPISNSRLAVSISRAGGLGIVASGYSVGNLREELDVCHKAGVTYGVGVINWATDI
jgi:NAD(P)H-dependent flavin oxidoreductase YrpB (nitropropane dioxygenase family)